MTHLNEGNSELEIGLVLQGFNSFKNSLHYLWNYSIQTAPHGVPSAHRVGLS